MDIVIAPIEDAIHHFEVRFPVFFEVRFPVFWQRKASATDHRRNCSVCRPQPAVPFINQHAPIAGGLMLPDLFSWESGN
jgi:hypothetical protein